eukprot:4599183-Prorocentrum_lima.AAC.1
MRLPNSTEERRSYHLGPRGLRWKDKPHTAQQSSTTTHASTSQRRGKKPTNHRKGRAKLASYTDN